ncbi:MAG: hypothetical protein IJO79_00080 [Firmicutes bacterium]|nr:hypothetical protein [Bacillota bacterium]
MKKRILLILACLLLVMALPVTAFADTGPKPSICIEFTHMPNETFYGTLLSERESTGPASAWDGKEPFPEWRAQDGGEEIWKKFLSYEDPDGYYFLQEWWECSDDGELNWTYYPPSPFKILLYFPDSDTFCVSPIYEKYAFDSYFKVNLSDWEDGTIEAKENYHYGKEILSLLARIVVTILIELGIALLIGYREKKLLTFLAVVNIITQVILNVSLNLINFNFGPRAFLFAYILLEIVVLLVEAGLYALLLQKFSDKPQTRKKATYYAVAANIVSFIVGIWLAVLIPGMF